MKYEVWALLKSETSTKEVLVREFQALGASCSYAGYLSETANDPCFLMVNVYQKKNGFRRMIGNFENTLKS